MGKGQFMVKGLGECLEISIGRVDGSVNITTGLRCNLSGCDHDALWTVLAGKTGDIHDEFSPDDRIIIGIGETRNTFLQSQRHHLFGTDAHAMGLVQFRLADVPVLTETTTKIATRGAEARDSSSWKKVI